MTADGEGILAWLERVISEREATARAALAFGDAFAAGSDAPDCIYGTGPGGPYMRVAVPGFEGQTEAAVAHFSLHGPDSVLRRCAADRKLLERAATSISCGEVHPGMDVYCAEGHRDDELIRIVAEGYGWTGGK